VAPEPLQNPVKFGCKGAEHKRSYFIEKS